VFLSKSGMNLHLEAGKGEMEKAIPISVDKPEEV